MYPSLTLLSMKKVSETYKTEVRAAVPSKIRQLREYCRLRQEDLAVACGVSRGAVARWEAGEDMPPPRVFVVLAKYAISQDQRWWWLGLAGIEKKDLEGIQQVNIKMVPLLKDSIAAGTPRAVDESEIERQLIFPTEWLPQTGTVTALRVAGDSMSPLIDSGYIVLVDTSQRDPKKLINKMVAAREADEVTIKWLRQEGRFFHLVPQHTSPRHPIRILTPESDIAIIGEVIRWIGAPPK
jgi:SOS-response transcriptional repressor LexA